MAPSLEGSPTKAKEAPSPHEVRLALLNTNPVFYHLEITLCVVTVANIKAIDNRTWSQYDFITRKQYNNQ